MDKIRLLTFSVIGLFILNVGVICFLYISKPNFEVRNQGSNNGNNHGKPNEIISKKLHFDNDQIKKYQAFIIIHRKKISALDDQNKLLKLNLYSELKQNVIKIKTKDSLINLLLINQKAIEELHFKHFKDIKSLCRKEQLEDFNKLTEELAKIFSNQRRRPPIHNRQKFVDKEIILENPKDFNSPLPKDLNESDSLSNMNNQEPPRHGNRPSPSIDNNNPRPPRRGNRPPPPLDIDNPRPPRNGDRPQPPRDINHSKQPSKESNELPIKNDN